MPYGTMGHTLNTLNIIRAVHLDGVVLIFKFQKSHNTIIDRCVVKGISPQQRLEQRTAKGLV